MHHEGSKKRSLGEQVLFLVNADDRLVALRRTTAAMQVTVARAIVLQALASVASRYSLTSAILILFHLITLTRNNCSLNSIYRVQPKK